jgi:AraC-like DNA-binding protein
LLLQLHVEYHTKRRNWDNIVSGLMNVFYQYLISLSSGNRKNIFVENFETILISNISNKDFSMSKALEHIPLCPDHFKKLFKKETGLTPSQYLMEKRINHAKQLLENGYSRFITIKQVAAQVGFDDAYYFSRVFKKYAGNSPLDWYNQIIRHSVPGLISVT